MDIELHDAPGSELIQSLRELWSFPILVLTHTSDLAARLSAFAAGADDYVIKGTELDEVVARVLAILRRTSRSTQNTPTSKEPAGVLEIPGRSEDRRSGANRAASIERRESHLSRRFRHRPNSYDVPHNTAFLVVDSDDSARQRLDRVLRSWGHMVIEAASGTQALLTVAKYHPLLIITELSLIDQDGFTMIQTLRHSSNFSNIAVIVIAGRSRPVDHEMAKSHRVLDYIVKPWDVDELRIRIDWATDAIGRAS